MVRTRSRPYGLCHRPYTKAHIKGFGSSYLHVYACLLLCLMLVLASLVLGLVMLDAFCGLDLVWLHLTPMGPCLDVTISKASPDAKLLRTYPSLSTPCDAMLTMFVRATRWLSMHLYTLAYMSMHESCLLVCRPCFNTMKLWKFYPNLHLSLGHHLLFVFLLVCLLACLLAFLFLCLPCLPCLFVLCLFHILFASFPSIACLLVSYLCLCMYTHEERTRGARA